MPTTKQVPAYRLHKASGQARVILNGTHVYLGKFDSPQSREKYHRLLAKHLADEQSTTEAKNTDATSTLLVNDLILSYWKFAQDYYVTNGKPTGELENIRYAIRPLRRLYGRTFASAFGPLALKSVRQHMIDAGALSRGVINNRINCIRRIFKWAVAEELVSALVYNALQTVAGLRFGRSEARETKPIRPVPDLHVCLVLPFVAPPVAAMIKLQRLTGMRAGEIVIMRPSDIDTSGDVWIYEPTDHKNRWRGHTKTVALGPEAQRIIEPYLERSADSYLFSPVEAEAWRRENRPPYQGRARKTPLYPSELRRRAKAKQDQHSRKRKSKRPKRNQYDTSTYRRAIEYGIRKAAKAGITIPHWHPHQLKHNRATEVRKQFGIEAAQIAIGNADADVTKMYAERDLQRAEQIALQMG